MFDSRSIEFRAARDGDLPAIRSFYSRVDYGAALKSDDRILVGTHEEEIIAAARLCSEKGHLVLRGMYVDATLRGAGVGSSLLGLAEEEIGPDVCWCVPYSHLGKFYARGRFEAVTLAHVPRFLRERRNRYREAGLDVVIMRRIP